MADISKITLPSGGTYDIKDASARGLLVVLTDDNCTVEKDATKGVSPYSTSYGYTNITTTANKPVEGGLVNIVVDTKLAVASAYRNVRVHFADDEAGVWHPVFGASSSVLAGSSYFAKAQTRSFVYKSVYSSVGILHLISDSDTNTYVRQYQVTNNVDYPLLARYNTTDKDGTYDASYARYTTGVTVNPSTNKITATDFVISGGKSLSDVASALDGLESLLEAL